MLGRILLIVAMSIASVAVVHASDAKTPVPPPQKAVEKETCSAAGSVYKLTPGRDKQGGKEVGPAKIFVASGSPRDAIQGKECPQDYCTVVWKDLYYRPQRACIRQGESVYVGEGDQKNVVEGSKAVLTDHLEKQVDALKRGAVPSSESEVSPQLKKAFAGQNIDQAYAEQLKPVADRRAAEELTTAALMDLSSDKAAGYKAADKYAALSEALGDSRNLTPALTTTEQPDGKTIIQPNPSDTFEKNPKMYNSDTSAPPTSSVVRDALKDWGKTAMDYAVKGVESFERWLAGDEVAVDPDAPPPPNTTDIPKTVPKTPEEEARLKQYWEEREESWAYQDKLAEENWKRGLEFEIQQAQEASKKAALEYQMEEDHFEALLASKNAAAMYQWEDERWDELYESKNLDAIVDYELAKEKEAQDLLDGERQKQEEAQAAKDVQAAREIEAGVEAAFKKDIAEAEKQLDEMIAFEAQEKEKQAQVEREKDLDELLKSEDSRLKEAQRAAEASALLGPFQEGPGAWSCRSSVMSDSPPCLYRGPDGYWRTENPYTAQERPEEAALARELQDSGQVRLGEETVRFDFGLSAIRPEDKPALDALSRALSDPAYQDTTIIIFGHTDSVGSEQSNALLSQRRAEAVAGYLMSTNASLNGRVMSYGLGEYSANQSPNPKDGTHRQVQVLVVPNLSPW